MGVSEIKDTLFGGPYNKDPTIQGTILGSPIFPCRVQGLGFEFRVARKRTTYRAMAETMNCTL